MGSAASAKAIEATVSSASDDEIKTTLAALDSETRSKLVQALAKGDSAKPVAANTWKIEAVPDGGILLCGHPGSGNVIPPMIFCNKWMKGKYNFQMCDIMKGEQMSADFLALNPFHQVPSAKMADGTCLYESASMLRFLAKKYAPETYPEDKQLIIDMAMDKRQTDLYKVWSPIGYYAMQIAPKPEEDAGKKLNEVLAKMATAFLSGKFVGGEALCIADYSILPLINTLSLPAVKKTGYTLPERWEKYLNDAKADLGDVFADSVKVHEGWLGGNVDKVEAVSFVADEVAPAASGDWKIETVPDGGILLCGHPGSGNVIPLMMFGSKWMKDKYKFQMCDIMKGEQKSADYLAMNPFHQVPSAKMADGTCLYESSSMLRFLAKKHAPETYPEDKQLIIDMALDKRQTDLYNVWSPIGYYAMQIAPKPQEDAGKKLNEVLATMAAAFLSGKFIGGDSLCIADYSILPLINTLSLPAVKKMGYTLPERWEKYWTDAKADLGAVFTESVAVHEGWLGGNVEKVEAVEFK